jgi:Salmonella virulence plasmid 65kDa B protein/Insecticide toxin TcdB middle/N-terminal region/Insecticide toxin TcdB middle/C-terminal region/FG-GAP-like repeat
MDGGADTAPLTSDRANGTRDDAAFLIAPPSLNLPKGGGAIRGMGEKFAANPVTGTGAMTVPITTSPGRSGFGPQLVLSYDSGSGNGPFGMGWGLGHAAVTRRTDNGLPIYDDARESDVFVLFGAEDLVPALELDSEGNAVVGRDGRPQFDEIPDQGGYRVRRYRPRIEGLFARIERWTRLDGGDTYWRSISRDNVTTFYGRSADSRIADPDDPRRVFSWLISESYDDKGNAIVYDYAQENGDSIDYVNLSQANERNRRRDANRYLRRIRYGNVVSRLDDPDLRASGRQWLFEVVFDYGEHDSINPSPAPAKDQKWLCRRDPFSTYRAGFEVRTYRLCQRVLMFHRFAELGSEPCLVRSTAFVYADDADTRSDPRTGIPQASFLRSVSWVGHAHTDEGSPLSRPMPPLQFKYSLAVIDNTVRDVDARSLENLPAGLDGALYQWVDLDNEGASGILTEQADGWFYKRNLSPVRDQAAFAEAELVMARPNAGMTEARAEFMDLAGEGRLDLVMLDGPTPGFYEKSEAGRERFRAFVGRPNRDIRDPNVRLVDLNGDGRADVLVTEDDVLTWYPSRGKEGFGAARQVAKARDEEKGPALVFSDRTQSIFLADMSGDGLSDLVRVRNGSICYWPNLGFGRFGSKVTMDDAPWLDAPDQFDTRRLRLADIDGSGTADLIYLARKGARVFFNQSGNRWSGAQLIPHYPPLHSVATVTVVDLLGEGTACLVWSSAALADIRAPMKYIRLMGAGKPHLLTEVRNNLGAITTIAYEPSTRFYLQDKLAGRPWVTRLPFPVHCVAQVTVVDTWRNTTFTSTYSYHHGHYDGVEREFRGFGRVEQIDVESYGKFAAANSGSPFVTSDTTLYQPPVKTVSWYHTGAFLDRERILSHYRHEYFPQSLTALAPPVALAGTFSEHELPEPDVHAQNLTDEEWREALRACKGTLLRQEIYELEVEVDAHGVRRPVKLFSTSSRNCDIRRVQPRGLNRHPVFLAMESETITRHYELDFRADQPSPDPRVTHSLNLRFDAYGRPSQSVQAVYHRLGSHSDDSLSDDQLALIRDVQNEQHLSYTETRFADPPQAELDNYRLPEPCEVLTFELTGFPIRNGYFDRDALMGYALSDTLPDQGPAAVAPLEYQQQPPDGSPYKRIVEHVITLYFKDDLSGPHPLGRTGWLGLTYESYKLALTASLAQAVLRRGSMRRPAPCWARPPLPRPSLPAAT